MANPVTDESFHEHDLQPSPGYGNYTDPYWIRNPEVHTTSLTNAQQISLCVVPIVPCILSVSCSIQIIYLVYRTKFNTPYKRILFMFSIADIVSSINLIVGPFVLPRETSYRYWAFGSKTTCKISGAMMQIGFASFWYYAVLSFYFLFTIRFGMTTATLVKYCEPLMHLFAVGFPLGTGVAGLILDVYDEADLIRGCWVSSQCNEHGLCKSNPSIIAWLFGGGPSFVVLLMIVVNNLVIFVHVRATIYGGLKRQNRRQSSVLMVPATTATLTSAVEEETKRYRFSTLWCSCSNSIRNGINNNAQSSATMAPSESQQRRVREVAIQAFLYVGAFLVTYLVALLFRAFDGSLYEPVDENQLYPALLYQSLSVPLIGCFNFLIFIRPTYLRARKDFPQQPKYWAMRRAMYGDSIRPITVANANTNLPSRSGRQRQNRLRRLYQPKPRPNSKSRRNFNSASRVKRHSNSSISKIGAKLDDGEGSRPNRTNEASTSASVSLKFDQGQQQQLVMSYLEDTTTSEVVLSDTAKEDSMASSCQVIHSQHHDETIDDTSASGPWWEETERGDDDYHVGLQNAVLDCLKLPPKMQSNDLASKVEGSTPERGNSCLVPLSTAPTSTPPPPPPPSPPAAASQQQKSKSPFALLRKTLTPKTQAKTVKQQEGEQISTVVYHTPELSTRRKHAKQPSHFSVVVEESTLDLGPPSTTK